MNETPTRLGTPYPTGDKFVASPPASSLPASAMSGNAPSFETMDRLARAVTTRFTQGISPYALYAAWFDWASHLSHAPGRLLELGLEAINAGAQLTRFVTRGTSNHAE